MCARYSILQVLHTFSFGTSFELCQRKSLLREHTSPAGIRNFAMLNAVFVDFQVYVSKYHDPRAVPNFRRHITTVLTPKIKPVTSKGIPSHALPPFPIPAL